MSQTPFAYQGSVLSARSRRLRTIGSLLLLAVIGMSIYGGTVLMPAINRSIAAHSLKRTTVTVPTPPDAALPVPAPSQIAAEAHARKVQRLQVAVAFAYWGVCVLLIVAILLIAWLDLREISRNYLSQYRNLRSEVAEGVKRDVTSRDGASEE